MEDGIDWPLAYERMHGDSASHERWCRALQIRAHPMASEEQPQPTEPKPEPAPGPEINGDTRHWWREPMAGIIAIVISCFDIWYIGKDWGLSGPLDELILLTGIALVAGIRNLFGARISSSQLTTATERQKALLDQMQRIEQLVKK